MVEHVRSLLESAEAACRELGLPLTARPDLWHYIDLHRRKDPQLYAGVPPEAGFDVHRDEEILRGDWLIPPEDVVSGPRSGAVHACCESGSVINAHDPSGKLFAAICERLGDERSESWRPLAWLTTVPLFSLTWEKKRELIREELRFFLGQNNTCQRTMLMYGIDCPLLTFAQQLEVLGIILEMDLDGQTLEHLCNLLATTEMEAKDEQLEKVLSYLARNVISWLIDAASHSEQTINAFGIACRNYLLRSGMPVEFAQAAVVIESRIKMYCKDAGNVDDLMDLAWDRVAGR